MSEARFEFASAARVIFGRGVSAEAARFAAHLGRRALVVSGRSAREPREGTPGVFTALVASLHGEGVGVVPWLVRGEPRDRDADEGVRTAEAGRCDLVIGVGGGSVLDTAKAISGLMTNGGQALDYLEHVGRGRTIDTPAAPMIAIPTTSGTGSEVTKNAVLIETASRVKVSMRSAFLLPSVALIDPEITRSLPPAFTAATGLDALSQLIEAFLTPRASPISDLFAEEGLRRSARSLLRAVKDGDDGAAREDLSLASLFGGFALANAGLGAVHGIAAPLGGSHPIPHGAACGILLPFVFSMNLRALRARDPASPALARMARIGDILIGAESRSESPDAFWAPSDDDLASAGAASLLRIVSSCGLPGLGAYGVTPGDFPALVSAAQRASSMKGNPIALSDQELAATLAAAL